MQTNKQNQLKISKFGMMWIQPKKFKKIKKKGKQKQIQEQKFFQVQLTDYPSPTTMVNCYIR